jgi:hypothetical protein
MNSGFDESWKKQDNKDVWYREKRCVDVLNKHLNNEVMHHSIGQMDSKYDCVYRGCHLELEERKENVICNDRYMFSDTRGLSALGRKISECSDPQRSLYLIYGWWEGKLFGYVHTYDRFRRDGILQDFGTRKDRYFVLLKDKAGSVMDEEKLAKRIKKLCESIQLTLE